MNILIGLISKNQEICEFFGKAKEKIVNKDLFIKGHYKNVAISFYTVTYIVSKKEVSSDDFERFLLDKIKHGNAIDACILLVDDECMQLVRDIHNSLFLSAFNASDSLSNPQNYFSGLITRLVRNFGVVFYGMSNLADLQILRLPLRNFMAKELNEIARLCREKCLSPTFTTDFSSTLAMLQKRRKPRRFLESKKMHMVDDHNIYYEYGNERHAQFETGKPHLHSCEIAGHFRFGVRIESRLHYNVFGEKKRGVDTVINGKFINCHDQEVNVASTSHLNMFSNDYF
jgi:hypothetical protein